MRFHPFHLALLVLCLASGAGAQPSPRSDPTPDRLAAGERLFERSCRICHGEAGVGSRAPALRGSWLTADYVARVIVEGKAGTMMPKFASAFTPGQLRGLSEYVVALQQPDSAWAAMRGDPASGERVFFDDTAAHSCQGCHQLQGRGRRVGPDLTVRLRGRTPREIFEGIVIVPHRSVDPAYASVEIALRSGERIRGIQAEETASGLRVYDTSVLPPAVRTLAKADVASVTRVGGSVMPSDYGSRLRLQQLLDLVAFLKTAADGLSAVVTLDDVVNRRAQD